MGNPIWASKWAFSHCPSEWWWGCLATGRFLSALLILARGFQCLRRLVESELWPVHVLEHYTVSRFRGANTHLITEGNGPTAAQITRPGAENSKRVRWRGCICPRSEHPETNVWVKNLPFLLGIRIVFLYFPSVLQMPCLTSAVGVRVFTS